MMGRARWSTLLALWLAGCGVYGPPEREASPEAAPAAASAAETSDDECTEPEQTR